MFSEDEEWDRPESSEDEPESEPAAEEEAPLLFREFCPHSEHIAALTALVAPMRRFLAMEDTWRLVALCGARMQTNYVPGVLLTALREYFALEFTPATARVLPSAVVVPRRVERGAAVRGWLVVLRADVPDKTAAERSAQALVGDNVTRLMSMMRYFQLRHGWRVPGERVDSAMYVVLRRARELGLYPELGAGVELGLRCLGRPRSELMRFYRETAPLLFSASAD